VIVASGNQAAQAAKAATTTIPIVFGTGGDPVALGLVASLNRPGANVTGITMLAAELAPKQLQLLRELIPNSALLGALADPAFPGTQFIIKDLQSAARTLGLQLLECDGKKAIVFDNRRTCPLRPCAYFPSSPRNRSNCCRTTRAW
jgi:putative ABC transport system substrate-binding protein